jgi:DNA repair protein RecO (recombination protein O)
LLDLVAYVSPRGGLTRLSEFRCLHPFRTAPYDMRKSSVLLFLSEVLGRTLREEEPSPELFEYLYEAMIGFDEQQEGFENFALIFLLNLAHYLGFGPDSGQQITEQVAFATDAHQSSTARSTVLRFQEFEHFFDELLHQPAQATVPNGRVRRELLTILLRYYQLHVENLGDIRSLDVLSEVLAE